MLFALARPRTCAWLHPHPTSTLQWLVCLVLLPWQIGSCAAAVDVWRRLVTAHPNALWYTHLGWLLHVLCRLRESAEACEAAIALDPEFGTAYNNLGAVYMSRGDVERAEGYFLQALDKQHWEDDTLGQPWVNLATIRARQGRKSEAVWCLHKALQRAPLDECAATDLADLLA